jgi:hypothetical protein
VRDLVARLGRENPTVERVFLKTLYVQVFHRAVHEG